MVLLRLHRNPQSFFLKNGECRGNKECKEYHARHLTSFKKFENEIIIVEMSKWGSDPWKNDLGYSVTFFFRSTNAAAVQLNNCSASSPKTVAATLPVESRIVTSMRNLRDIRERERETDKYRVISKSKVNAGNK